MGSIPVPATKQNTMKIKFLYRKTAWWRLIHYNYFHRKLFKEFYVQRKRPFTEEQIKKYRRYEKLDNLITLRKIDWLRILIWRLER